MSILIHDVEVVFFEDGENTLPACFSEKGMNIYIVDDLIAGIGREEFPQGDTVIEGKNLVAMPGFINAHTHAAMTMFRGLGDDLPLDVWLQEKMWPAEDKLTPEDVYWAVKLALVEMIKSGTTAFADMYFLMEEAISAIEESGLKASLCRAMAPFQGDYQYVLKEAKDFIYKWRGAASGRISAVYGPHAPYTCPPQFLKEVAAEAKKDGAGIHIHLSETIKEIEEIKEQYGCSPIELALETGLLDVHVLAAHCVHVNDRDIAILAEKGASVAHNPQSNLKLGSGIAPVPAMLKAGIPVALGTDGTASNNNLDMIEEMRTAALLHKGYNMDPTLVPASEAVKMATVNGALAMGMSNSGSLKVGHKADLILLDFNQAHLFPQWDTVSHIVYSAQASDVHTMIVDGNIIMHNREIKTIDAEEAYFEVNSRFRRYQP